ncbi:cyclophilin-like fold protein [Ponticaulis sp.]|uniref:cyclophilin-like fold protein n=1 Tax=Ponticaulis sp. TaxID=2020902 RepID=UPI000B6B585A|nr:cyclophilin-like fold protein [Ponticaulis sp.]MAI89912.1 hypothetical protein [Ponticaulis sp.]OUX99583.1 MAG: hypothetical protein CBB65_05680 [Hyphomonadaceae bacterium TMED5]|tara:strand:+ start:102270 stop:102623 length:354 start_codon:yes stop_codon:yes gene_type:complete
MTRICITIDGQALKGELNASPPAEHFASLLPLTLTLNDYALKEKVSRLPKRLNSGNSPAGHQPSAGDITFYASWGNLAIFYEDFEYAAGLVKLGRITGPLDAFKSSSTLEARIEHAE